MASSSQIPADYGDLEDQLRLALDRIQTLEAAAADHLAAVTAGKQGNLEAAVER